jgi:protein gp37
MKMAANSEISWTDTTWNPLAGCTWQSPGCDRCYAAVMARRLDAMAQADIAAGRDPGRKRKYMGTTNKNKAGRIMFNGKVNLDESALSEPLTWAKPRLVFVNSMSDLFHKDVPFSFVADVFNVMRRASKHTFQVLTKRTERMAQFFAEWAKPGYVYDNVWCGTSVENQEQADKRIPHLLKVPARVRFLSCEPLLGPIDLGRAIPCGYYCDERVGHVDHPFWTPRINSPIHWVICGGESGPGARAMHPDWARSLRDQCVAAGVAFHFKQWGQFAPANGDARRTIHPKYSGDLPDGFVPPASFEVEYGGMDDPDGRTPIALPDGTLTDLNWNGGPGAHLRGGVQMISLGKHAAGRLLDGRTWDQFPR